MKAREIAKLSEELLQRPEAYVVARHLRDNFEDLEFELDENRLGEIILYCMSNYFKRNDIALSIEALSDLWDVLEPYANKVPDEVAQAVDAVFNYLEDTIHTAKFILKGQEPETCTDCGACEKITRRCSICGGKVLNNYPCPNPKCAN